MRTVVFTQRVEVIGAYDERRDCADQRIADYIHTCGFLPLPVPNNPTITEEIVRQIKPVGIVLVGGNSLVKYGGDAPERDDTDTTLLRFAVEKHISVYGFCRGMQSILDFFCNDLVNVKGHVAVKHKILGVEENDIVNSYHNQACIFLKNDNLIALMKTDDGVIEKVKHKSLPIWGTMWHPEREYPFREKDVNLLRTIMGV